MNKFRVNSVLLIDDNEIDNFINRKVLEQMAFSASILEAQSAGAALALLKRLAEEELPDYIFLDIHMPIMDGFGFLKEFENLGDVVHNKCKVIVVSSSLDQRDYDKALLNRHVVHFFNKPFSPQQIRQIQNGD